ncbi:hypothetical protein OBBRIDRAFT_838148 [Obba rivulosa]|uniref:Exoribonuclease phosphorolytic domain-containing protein n=1 Tax=Obba rivulosa TaxID=1052685 RepID=A0A8E2DGZ8_9APHY|nr:hypothetical protein OBBRIDRAFT_838148 [Obba rivulosa]
MSTTTRSDGRTYDQLRDIMIVYEGLDGVDGSARFGFGQTQSLTSVSGPMEVRPNLEQPSQATLDISVRPLVGIAGTDSKALSTNLKAILAPALFLSHHPRTLIQIVGQALCGTESGSGLGSVGKGWNATLVASLINATSAALVNASSVPMKGVICAVSVGRFPSASAATLVLDPSEAELPHLVGGGCFAFLFSSALPLTPSSPDELPPCSLLWTNYTSSVVYDDTELRQAQALAEEGARKVWAAMKESVSNMERTAQCPAFNRFKSAKTESRVKKDTKNLSESEVDDDKMEI